MDMAHPTQDVAGNVEASASPGVGALIIRHQRLTQIPSLAKLQHNGGRSLVKHHPVQLHHIAVGADQAQGLNLPSQRPLHVRPAVVQLLHRDGLHAVPQASVHLSIAPLPQAHRTAIRPPAQRDLRRRYELRRRDGIKALRHHADSSVTAGSHGGAIGSHGGAIVALAAVRYGHEAAAVVGVIRVCYAPLLTVTRRTGRPAASDNRWMRRFCSHHQAVAIVGSVPRRAFPRRALVRRKVLVSALGKL
mmetsp:Transcript_5242/g.15021  ORF Transcript_5242/g.15021 Transcript_5242/m.15021 type:complete len:247 (+) Transcript_5242:2529-3269(+)